MNYQHKVKKEFSEKRGTQTRRYGIYSCEDCEKEVKVTLYDAKKRKNILCLSCSSKRTYEMRENFNSIKYNKINGEPAYKTRIYKIWQKIKSRCKNKNNDKYCYYGMRGINICNEWEKDFISFYDWAMDNGYKEKLTIDRIDNDGNYEPNNCRWVAREIQSRNQRVIRKNNTTGYKGVSTHQNGYIVQITVSNKNIYIGYFKNAKDGAIAYNNYVIKNKLEHTLNEI